MTGSCAPRLHSLITSVSVLQACESDVGVTLATGVSQWNDLSGAARHYTQATGANQPAYTANLAGYPVLTFDGTNDSMTAAGLVLPSPGTTPTYAALVARNNAFTTNRVFLGDTQTGANYPLYFNCHTLTPDVYQFNGGSQINSAMTIGGWFLVELYFSNTTADFIRVGSTNVTGVTAGNLGVSTGRMLGFGNGTSMARGSFTLASVLYAAGLPTTAERAALRAVVAGKFRGLVQV